MIGSVVGAVTPAATRARLETALIRRFDAAGVVLTDSGTTALRLAVEVAAAGARRPVALPAYGCFDLATALDGAGFEARLYDVDPRTLGPVWADFERVIAAGVSSAVIVHLFGLPVDAERARAITARAGIPLVEDAAQAAGARIGNRPAGGFGDLAVLSFGRGKGLTGGGGGALLLRDEGTVRTAAGLPPLRAALGARALPVLAALAWVSRPALYGMVSALPFLGLGETPYHPPHPPAGLGLLSAGAVLDTLQRLDDGRAARAQVAQHLAAAAGPLAPDLLAGAAPGFLRFPIVPPEPARGSAPIGLGAAPGYPKALVDLPGFRERVMNATEAFPGARRLAQHLVTLPTHRWVSAADLAALEAWLVSLRPPASD